jgi:hypothetical protein
MEPTEGRSTPAMPRPVLKSSRLYIERTVPNEAGGLVVRHYLKNSHIARYYKKSLVVNEEMYRGIVGRDAVGVHGSLDDWVSLISGAFPLQAIVVVRALPIASAQLYQPLAYDSDGSDENEDQHTFAARYRTGYLSGVGTPLWFVTFAQQPRRAHKIPPVIVSMLTQTIMNHPTCYHSSLVHELHEPPSVYPAHCDAWAMTLPTGSKALVSPRFASLELVGV